MPSRPVRGPGSNQHQDKPPVTSHRQDPDDDQLRRAAAAVADPGLDDDDGCRVAARHSVDEMRQIEQQIDGFQRHQPRAGGVGNLETGWYRNVGLDGPIDVQVRSIMEDLGERRSGALVTVGRADGDADRVTVRDGDGAVKFERLVPRGTADDVAEEFNPLPEPYSPRQLGEGSRTLEHWAAGSVARAELLEADLDASSVEIDANSAAATRLHQAMAQRLELAPGGHEVRDDEGNVWDGAGSGTVNVLLQSDYTPDYSTPEHNPATELEFYGDWDNGILGGVAGWRDDDAGEPYIDVPISTRALAEDLGLA